MSGDMWVGHITRELSDTIVTPNYVLVHIVYNVVDKIARLWQMSYLAAVFH